MDLAEAWIEKGDEGWLLNKKNSHRARPSRKPPPRRPNFIF